MHWICSRESLDRRDSDHEHGQSTGGVPATAAGIPPEWMRDSANDSTASPGGGTAACGAAIKLDNENHFNMVVRHAALQFCASRPKLAPIMPSLHALHEYGSPLHYHDGTRADDAVEGGKQGGVMAGQLAALAPQPVLIAADSALRESGGFATAIIDDGYLLFD